MAATTSSASRGIAILTGANGVFGRWIAKSLVENKYETVLVVRDKAKGAALVENLEKQIPDAKVRYALVDCSSHASIKNFANTWSGGRNVEILINNAVLVPTERKTSPETGIELQFATNVLAYHWFTKEFQSHFTANARVVFVASHYAGGLDLTDVEFKKRTYEPNSAYRASKQANRMLAAAWAEKFAESQENKSVVVTSCHPGIATSNCSLGLGFDMDREEAAQRAGAVTPLFCALTEASKLKSGGFYADSKLEKCQFTSKNNQENIEKLWNLVESYP